MIFNEDNWLGEAIGFLLWAVLVLTFGAFWQTGVFLRIFPTWKSVMEDFVREFGDGD